MSKWRKTYLKESKEVSAKSKVEIIKCKESRRKFLKTKTKTKNKKERKKERKKEKELIYHGLSYMKKIKKT